VCIWKTDLQQIFYLTPLLVLVSFAAYWIAAFAFEERMDEAKNFIKSGYIRHGGG